MKTVFFTLVAFSGACLASACSGDATTAAPTPTPGAQTPRMVAGASPSPTPAGAAVGAPGISRVTIEVVSGKVDDKQPNLADSVRAKAETWDPDNDGVSVSWQWSVDGNPVSGAIAETFALAPYKKGAKVRAEGIPRDTRGVEGAKKGTEITIRNSLPVITSVPGASLDGYRVVATDLDGEPLTLTMEAPVPGFTLSPEGVLKFDKAAGKAGEGQSIVILAKDGEGAFAKQSITVKF